MVDEDTTTIAFILNNNLGTTFKITQRDISTLRTLVKEVFFAHVTQQNKQRQDSC